MVATNHFKILATAILFIFVNTLFAQIEYSNQYCTILSAKRINDSLNHFFPDSLYAYYVEDGSEVNLIVVNTTNKEYFLFSSYFPNSFLFSKFIHRIDPKNKQYHVSFLPLVPYLSTKLDDRLILGYNKMIVKGQILYSFVSLLPGHYYSLHINYKDLFNMLSTSEHLVRNFDLKEKSKFDEIKFKYLKIKKIKDKYDLFFDFAIYSKINIICDLPAYYLQEFEFNKQANSYKKLSIQVQAKHFIHSILK